MNSGQRHPPDSRLTTATVLMHWQARTKKTISETPASGVISVRAVRPGRRAQHVRGAARWSRRRRRCRRPRRACRRRPRGRRTRRGCRRRCASRSRAGAIAGSIRRPTRPATLLRSCAPLSWLSISTSRASRSSAARAAEASARARLLGLGGHRRVLRIRQQRPQDDGQRENDGAGVEQEGPDALPDAAQQHAEHRQAVRAATRAPASAPGPSAPSGAGRPPR